MTMLQQKLLLNHQIRIQGLQDIKNNCIINTGMIPGHHKFNQAKQVVLIYLIFMIDFLLWTLHRKDMLNIYQLKRVFQPMEGIEGTRA
jgi:hypothetical protein